MRLNLNEIMAVIDKIKSAGLTSFEYQDADIRLKIGNKNTGGGDVLAGTPGSGMTGAADVPEQSAESFGTGQAAAAAEPNAADPQGSRAAYSGREAAEAPGTEPPREEASAPEKASRYTVIESPMVGVFYSAPSEKEEPFVKTGDTVKAGQTVGLVEAMKLMNEIEAKCSGTVEEILVENGQMVEYGQPLMRVKVEE